MRWKPGTNKFEINKDGTYTGWVNLYLYVTGRLHSGTGVYSSQREAESVANNKPNYVTTVSVIIFKQDLERLQ